MKKYKIKMTDVFTNSLYKSLVDLENKGLTDGDCQRMMNANLMFVKDKVYHILVHKKRSYTINITEAEAWALRIFFYQKMQGENIYIGSLMLRYANQIDQYYAKP